MKFFYAARWVAKSLVKAKLVKRCLVQVSYAIGVAHPISVFVTGYGTSKYSDDQLTQIVNHNFDLRPGIIVRELDLKKPIYQATSSYKKLRKKSFRKKLVFIGFILLNFLSWPLRTT